MCLPENQDIKVSVVMPIYNAYDYLRPAIDSVLTGTLKEIEIICVDDGSTDHSLDILKEYQAADPRVRIITESNAGPAVARNKGLSRARGEFVIFLDADDFYHPTLLEKLYNLAVEKNLDISVADYDIFNSRKSRFERNIPAEHADIFKGDEVVSKSTYPDEIFQCVSNYVWNKMFRRSFLTEKGLLFDEELRVFEDAYFVMTSLSLASAIGKVNEVLIHHRVYSAQSKNRLFKKYYAQVPLIYERIKAFLMHNGMYAPLSQSFLNLSASRAYKIYNLLWKDAKEEFWNLYHDSYAESLGWTAAEPEYFENPEVRDFCANVLVYTYDQHEKRERQGKKLSLKVVGSKLKIRERLRKIKAFFTKSAE